MSTVIKRQSVGIRQAAQYDSPHLATEVYDNDNFARPFRRLHANRKITTSARYTSSSDWRQLGIDVI
jgi:hypothetical protein